MRIGDVANALLALATVIVAIFAAASASRSARAAERQVQHAERMERLRLERDVAIAAHRTIASSISVMDTAGQLRAVYQALYGLRHELDSPEHQARDSAAEKRQQSASQLQGEANELLERRAKWKHNEDDELFLHLSRMEGYAVQLERARLRLERDLQKFEVLLREESELLG